VRLTVLEFGSLLSYTPRGSSAEIQRARDVMLAIKNDDFLEQPPIQMSQWIATKVQQNIKDLPIRFLLRPRHGSSSCSEK
jgi:hypothetical protein